MRGILNTLAVLALAARLGAAAPTSATIANSGSTNTSGFRIVIEKSGNAEYTLTKQKETKRLTIAKALVERFYKDLAAAQPFSALPQQKCAKSTSFGTTLTVQFGDEETPDLSCPGEASSQVTDLRKDVNDIMALFRAK
jgi:hypothetical protein